MVLRRMCINLSIGRWNSGTLKAYLFHTGKHVIVTTIIGVAQIWYMKETGTLYIAI